MYLVFIYSEVHIHINIGSFGQWSRRDKKLVACSFIFAPCQCVCRQKLMIQWQLLEKAAL